MNMGSRAKFIIQQYALNSGTYNLCDLQHTN